MIAMLLKRQRRPGTAEREAGAGAGVWQREDRRLL